MELYPAEDRQAFKFTMLDKRDFSPVGYKRYSKTSGPSQMRLIRRAISGVVLRNEAMRSC